MKKKAKKATTVKARPRRSAAVPPAAPAVVEAMPMEDIIEQEIETVPVVAAPEPTPARAPAPPAAAKSTVRAGLKLETSCLLRDSPDLQFQLLAADFGEGAALVDGSAVERVDTAGLQLIISFIKYQEGRGRRVGWTAVSDELRKAANQLGLQQQMRLEEAAMESAT
jgi:phospholipid transport system transporter-binding protein